MSEIDAGDKNAAGASGILIGAETVVKAQEAAAKLKDKKPEFILNKLDDISNITL